MKQSFVLSLVIIVGCLVVADLNAADKFTELHRAKTQIELAEGARKDTDYPRAIEFYERALSICQKHRGGTSSIPNIYYQMGSIAMEMRDLSKAMEYFNLGYQASESIETGGAGSGAILTKQGRIALMKGQVSDAQRLATKAIDVLQRKLPGSLSEAEAWDLLTDIQIELEHYDKAETFLVKKVTIENKRNPRGLDVAHTLDRLGWICLQAGAYARAESYYLKAFELRREVSKNGLPVAISCNRLGYFNAQQGKIDEAFGFYDQALNILTEIAPFSLDLAETHHYLGYLYNLQEDFSKANDHLQQALVIRRELAPDTTLLADTLTELSISACGRKEWRDAQQYNDHVFKVLESRIGVSPSDRHLVLDRLLPAYRLDVLALVEDKKPRDAFEALEHARGREFAERLLNYGGYPHLGQTAQYQSEVKAAQKDFELTLAAISKWIWPRHEEHIQFLQRYNMDLLDVNRELISAFKKANPVLGKFYYPDAFDLKRLQEALDDDTVYVTWSLHEDRSYLFAIKARRRDVEVYQLAETRQSLTDKVNAFRKNIALVQTDEHALTKLKKEGYDLFESLFGPAAKFIGEELNLVICPEGPLQLLPFDALVTSRKDDGKFLVQDHNLYYAVSAASFVESGQADEGAQSGHSLSLLCPPGPKGTSPLFGSEQDSKVLAESVDGLKFYSGDSVTENLFRHSAERSHSLVIASRVNPASQRPLDSGFLLAPDGDDKTLSALDFIEHGGLHTRLLHFPGCETGGASGLDPWSYRGFTEACLSSGAQSLLISLWPVISDEARQLLIQFYQKAAADDSFAQALRSAQLSVIEPANPDDGASESGEDTPEPVARHPYFWAGQRLYSPVR
jgi:CHAT domain-containing protein/Tfp pilus assembly protein PilF